MRTGGRGLRAGRLGVAAAVIATLAFGACGADEGEAAPPATGNRIGPNLVVVYLDDLDWLVSPFWDAMPNTRTLVADRGVTFTHAFANNPACCPARATTKTGRHAHNTGVEANVPPAGGFRTFRGAAEEDTIATRLSAHGYATAFLGKYLNGYRRGETHVAPGWDEWFAFTGTEFYRGYDYEVNDNGTLVEFGSAPEDYQTDVLSRRSVAFVERVLDEDPERPFLLFVSSSAPHIPLPPAPRHADHRWRDAELPPRPNFDEADVSDKPTWLREGVPPVSDVRRSLWQGHYRNWMGSLLAVDDLVVDIVEALDDHGVLDETVIVFTSDNGYNWGAHRIGAKLVPYEESIRIPMVVAGAGVTPGTRDEFVSLVDLAPTLLDLAGAPWEDLDGRSFAPLLAGDEPAWVDEVLLWYRGSYFGYEVHTLDDVRARIDAGEEMSVPTYRGLRSGHHLYVEWYGGDEHELELYDLDDDPYQLENLLASPEGRDRHASLADELHARLEAHSGCAGPSCREVAP